MQRYSMGNRDKCYKRYGNIHNKNVQMLHEISNDVIKNINQI